LGFHPAAVFGKTVHKQTINNYIYGEKTIHKTTQKKKKTPWP
jgi:hypothetical protein